MNPREQATVMANLTRLAELGYIVTQYTEGCRSASLYAFGQGKRPIAVHTQTMIEASYTAVSIAEVNS